MIYDLIIIGGGPAGYHAALDAAQKGLKAVLLEGKKVGGTCLNEGCIPSKALLHTAKVFEYAKNAKKYGVSVSDAKIDQPSAVMRKDRIVKALVRSIEDSLKKAGVLLVPENAAVDGGKDGAFQVSTASAIYTGRRLLLCTGSESSFPPIPGIGEAMEQGFAVSSTEILSLEEVPSELLILGGGIIGLEMAQYYALAGSSVKVIEMLDHIGGNMDPELSRILKRELEQKGVEFILSAKASKFEANGLLVETGSGTCPAQGDKVLISTGRRPRISGMGFENIGLDLSKKCIPTDENMQTRVPGVFAAGDINGKSMLAHTAYREAEVAVSNILGERETMNYRAVPSVVYTNPEAAWVGETEDDLIKRGAAYESIKLPMMVSGRYAAEGGTPRGMLKAYRDKDSGKLLGVHMLGNGASEFIFGAAMVMETGLTVDQAGKTIFPHPTVSEVFRECLNNV